MECINHPHPAKAICINCGSGLCPDCTIKTESLKWACSSQCVSSIDQLESQIQQNSQKATGGLTASAYGSYLIGIIMIAFGIIIGDFGGMIFFGVMGAGMLIMGGLYHRNIRDKKKSVSKTSQSDR
jgi:hypothetical protein